MFFIPIKTRISFKNRRFLLLKPPLLADETDAFSVNNRSFLREKAWNEAVFISCRFLKTWLYAMPTWQIAAFSFLFRQKSRR